MLRALSILLLVLFLAGCGGGSKLSEEDVDAINEANRAVSQSFLSAGQAVVQCSKGVSTEKAAAACVDENFAKVEPVVDQALVSYDSVLESVEDEACRGAVEAYRTDLASGGELVSDARRAALGFEWDRLSEIGNRMQSRFVADIEADERQLIEACKLKAEDSE